MDGQSAWRQSSKYDESVDVLQSRALKSLVHFNLLHRDIIVLKRAGSVLFVPSALNHQHYFKVRKQVGEVGHQISVSH